MKSQWIYRKNSPMPYQIWNHGFHPEDIIKVETAFGDVKIGTANSFWWGYGQELGGIAEGVIVKARLVESNLLRSE